MVANENDARFLRHLADSDDAVWRVAHWLQARGHSVTVPPMSVRRTYAERMQHVDNGDLYINQRIEVKRRGFNFTGRHDFPFPDFIVCARHSFDNAVPKPFAYVIVSADYKTAGIALCEATQKYWTTDTLRDHRYDNVAQALYFCPLEHVKFIGLA